MINIKDAQNIHSILIDKFGGSEGVRDIYALESAIFRPYATFEQIDLYPTAIDKAAAILESILINHPFIDGNKRTAYMLMKLILMEENVDLKATQEEKYNLVIEASTGNFRFEEIKNWLSKHAINIEPKQKFLLS